MSSLLWLLGFGAFLFVSSPYGFAGGGVYIGAGIPHAGRLGTTYQFDNSFGVDGSYGRGNLSRPCTDLEFMTSQLSLIYHPFAASFYLGVGGGAQRVVVTNIYTPTNGSRGLKVHQKNHFNGNRCTT